MTQARVFMAQFLPKPCARCGKEIGVNDEWVIGHIKPRGTHPHLMWDKDNWQHEHRACSDKTGQIGVIEKARAQGAREATQGRFPQTQTVKQPPPLPFSLPGARESQDLPAEAMERLSWSNFTQTAPAWLQPHLIVPDDASAPMLVSPIHAEAVGSYGEQAIEWIEDSQRITLRWWQRLAIVLQLQHREDGSLVIREIVESAPRRAGKSLRLRGVILWRMAHAHLFGEIQTVIHTGSDVPICREIQRGAWRWAEDVAGWTVSRSNGKEAIESTDGDRWLVRAQDSVYGYDACLGVVDEGWDVKPSAVSEGLEPATLERSSPQLHLTSTAHRMATSLMPGRLAAAIRGDDLSTLLMLWCAPAGADPADPKTWRAASPHWSEDRARMIANKYAAAVAGQEDPEADDPDPMAGFEAQYLNRWRMGSKRTAPGTEVVTEDAWAALEVDRPQEIPQAVAVEAWLGDVSVAYAWSVDGRTVVSAADFETTAAAAAAIRDSGYRGRVAIGASLVEDRAFRGLRKRSMKDQTKSTVAEVSRMLAEGNLAHDGSEHLAEQMVGLRTSPGTDGPRMRSNGRADAVKAMVWAANAVRSPRPEKARILLPSGV